MSSSSSSSSPSLSSSAFSAAEESYIHGLEPQTAGQKLAFSHFTKSLEHKRAETYARARRPYGHAERSTVPD